MASSRKRILYVITDLQVGGVPLHVQRLATAMHELGHAVRVVSLARPGPVSDMIQQAGLEVASCHAKSTLSMGALWRLRREIAAFKPDIIHSFLFHANIACRFMAPLAFASPRKLICEIQTVEIERRRHLSVDRWTHRLCRMEIGNSPSVMEHLTRAAGLPRSKLLCVPGGIDVDRIAGAQAVGKTELGVAMDHRLLLWIGRLDPVKGLDDLLAALTIINEEIPAHLVIVGEGPDRGRVVKQIRHLGLEDTASLLGVRRDVPHILKACDVFVFPSLTEGMPNALLEAMAAGCPIVCTDVPGNRDLIVNGETGVCVPPGNPEALAAGVLKLLKNNELAGKMGARACEVARTSYNHDLMVDRYLEVYSRV